MSDALDAITKAMNQRNEIAKALREIHRFESMLASAKREANEYNEAIMLVRRVNGTWVHFPAQYAEYNKFVGDSQHITVHPVVKP